MSSGGGRFERRLDLREPFEAVDEFEVWRESEDGIRGDDAAAGPLENLGTALSGGCPPYVAESEAERGGGPGGAWYGEAERGKAPGIWYGDAARGCAVGA